MNIPEAIDQCVETAHVEHQDDFLPLPATCERLDNTTITTNNVWHILLKNYPILCKPGKWNLGKKHKSMCIT